MATTAPSLTNEWIQQAVLAELKWEGRLRVVQPASPSRLLGSQE
jgi:hypothetical protein